MGKYDPLRDRLAACAEDVRELTMSFDEIEELVGQLPRSARVDRAWWANTDDARVEAQAWRTAGWQVRSVDQTAERVVFARSADAIPPGTRNASLPEPPEIVPDHALKARDPLSGRADGARKTSAGTRNGPQRPSSRSDEMRLVLHHLAAHFSQADTDRLDTPFAVPGLDFQSQIAPALRRFADASPPYITGISVAEANYPIVITGLTEHGWNEVGEASNVLPFTEAPTGPTDESGDSDEDAPQRKPDIQRHTTQGTDADIEWLLDPETRLDRDATKRALAWLDRNESSGEAPAVLRALLNRSDLGRDDARRVVQRALAWLDRNESSGEAPAVLEALLNRSDLGRDRRMVPRALAQ